MDDGSYRNRWRVFDVLSNKLQNLRFNSDESKTDDCIIMSDDKMAINDLRAYESTGKASFVMMELDVLEKKIKRLVNKLKRSNIHLEVFDASDIEYGPMLGKGGEGLVRHCTVRYHGLRIKAAIKTVLNNSDDSLSLTFDEIELLCLARDTIVMTTIQVYGVAAVPDNNISGMGHLVIVMEAGLMNALQLYQTQDIPLHVTYNIWSHLAAALHCIHQKRIIHQDLKPENILITGILRDVKGNTEKVQVKVIDFGMARLVEEELERVYTDDVLGTEGYHAPEVLFDESYDFRADIFVLGITFCILLLPRASLKKTTLLAIMTRIHESKQKKFVGSALFDHIISPMLQNNGHLISDDIKQMICLMLESVEKRTITLLDVAHTCHKEYITLQQQLSPIHSEQHCSSRLYHQDSGIDSLEDAVISNNITTKKNTRLNGGQSSAAAAVEMEKKQPLQSIRCQRRRQRPLATPQPKKRTTKAANDGVRHRMLTTSTGSTGSETNNGCSSSSHMRLPRYSAPPVIISAETRTKAAAAGKTDEPICRRTRSAKRLLEEEEDGGGVKKPPPRKRLLRSDM